MKIKLTATTHIPDETWEKSEEHPERPYATNYAGAEIEVGEALGEALVAEGRAVSLEPVPAEEPTSFRSRRSE